MNRENAKDTKSRKMIPLRAWNIGLPPWGGPGGVCRGRHTAPEKFPRAGHPAM